ncbi:MAG: SPOR domain-containing protein [Legionella sp.]|nr:SPOR domain-containing protein [Legionella sp.]
MKDVILKRITTLHLLLLIAITPQLSFAYVIYGLDKARQFQSNLHGSFSIYAGAFRSKQSAYQLRDKIASHNKYTVRVIFKNQLYAVVLGPLPSSEAVRLAGSSLDLKPQPAKKIFLAEEQPKRTFIVSSPLTTPRQFRYRPTNFLSSEYGPVSR